MVGVVEQRPDQFTAGECVLVNVAITGQGWSLIFHCITCRQVPTCHPTRKRRFTETKRRELLLTLAQQVKSDNPEFRVGSDERNLQQIFGNQVCKTPTLNSGTSGFSAAASSAVVMASRVSTGSMILSIQSRAAP